MSNGIINRITATQVESLFVRSVRFVFVAFITFAAIIWFVAAVALLILIFHHHFPNVLSFEKQILRDDLELLFFLVNIIVLPLGLFALWIARGHATELENTRHGALYTSMVDKWNSSSIVYSRKLFLELRGRHSALTVDQQSEEVSRFLFELGESQHLMKHRSYMGVLYFFEDLGVLCRKHYIREDDVFNFIGDNIVSYMETLKPYIRMERQAATRDPNDISVVNALYANALYLYKRAKRYQPQFHQEEL